MDQPLRVRTELYPDIEPFQSGRLPVDALHTMYWEQSGNPSGVPVLFLHGGPGAGASPGHRRFFDPSFYRIVIYDQRGAGRSTPHGSLIDNTTPHLIADIERLRSHLRIDRWVVFGGSWGATLGLAYAEAYPERCLGLVLRGVFLCRDQEIDWFLYGLRQIFPDAWRNFVDPIPEAQRSDLLTAYSERLNHPDPAVHLPAARAWSMYEGACSTLLPSPDTLSYFSGDHVALGLARIEAHFFRHRAFLAGDALLANVETLRSVPGVIVQGRYDMICPIVSADELHRAWPEAAYVVVGDAGHSAWEPGIRGQLVAATERFKSLLPI
ncbi:MAG TPA: prolyl aminopeptidase [Burkholderiales bacterium]|nr:prolyl aminopeptidase [Burkholderiales bacterium]